jgi:hypothetical protein
MNTLSHVLEYLSRKFYILIFPGSINKATTKNTYIKIAFNVYLHKVSTSMPEVDIQ